MNDELMVKNIFRLSDGTTVFACEGGRLTKSLKGCGAVLMLNGEVQQRIVHVSERTMIKKTCHENLRAIETRDNILLTKKEAESGLYRIILD